MNRFFLQSLLLALLNAWLPASFAGINITQVGRYTTVDNKPTAAQVNPLLAVAEYRFSPSVKTIGQAVQRVLDNTSYALVPKQALSQAVKDTLAKPLPMTDRLLGPLRIKEALIILMGKDVFTLMVDPLHREINFDIKPRIAKALNLKAIKPHHRIKA